MGATAISDPEAQPLLKPLPEPVKEAREWKGHWTAVGGDCSAPDVAACCLTMHAPWVAFGWNSSRGLGLVWWKEALKMFLLTTVVFALLRGGLCVLAHTRCHRPGGMDMPGAVSVTPGEGVNPAVTDFYASETTTTTTITPLDEAADAAATASVSTATSTAASTAASTDMVDAATSTDEDDDDAKADVPHTHHHKHDEDHKHKHDKEHDDEAPHDKPDGKHRHHEEEEHDDDEDDDEDDVHHPHFFWHPRHDFDDDDDMMMMRGGMDEDEFAECIATKVAPWALLMLAVAMSSAGYAVYLAALRRRMIREKFGIAGDFRHDVLLWAGCGACALAQETRTLMANRVEEGVWHGPALSLAQPPPAATMAA